MVNFLSHYKKNNKNLYSLMVSLLLAMWYNGISGFLNYLFPNRAAPLTLLLIFIPLVIFLTDDGKLDELYRGNDIDYPILGSSGKSVTSGYYYPQKVERFRTIPMSI